MDEQVVDASGLIAMADAQAQKVKEAYEQEQRIELGRHASSDTAPLQGSLSFPPGFVGALAEFIYQAAPRPVPEVAIVGALGIMAGIAGREWQISGTGMNLYAVLVARSAIGKEAMLSGISMLSFAASDKCPEVGAALDFSDYASGPALTKACLDQPCFVNVASELGHKFSLMAKDKFGPMSTFRRTLTDLYMKSSPSSTAGGITYSNADNNIQSVQAVAFSLIGETTPSTFFESLTPAMMEDGFLSRFCVVEYRGDRPSKNKCQLEAPPPEIVQHTVAIMQQSIRLRTLNEFVRVAVSIEAQSLLDSFEEECDHNIVRAGDDESVRAVWNRSHLKALRVAGLLAVGINAYKPLVSYEEAQWAIQLICHGNTAFLKRLQDGDVGDGSDSGREQKVLELCKEFLMLTSEKLPDWLKEAEAMRQASVVPRKYLQRRTQRLSAFENHKLGHTAALNMAIKTAIANGNLMEVKKESLVESYNFHGQAYRVLSLPK